MILAIAIQCPFFVFAQKYSPQEALEAAIYELEECCIDIDLSEFVSLHECRRSDVNSCFIALERTSTITKYRTERYRVKVGERPIYGRRLVESPYTLYRGRYYWATVQVGSEPIYQYRSEEVPYTESFEEREQRIYITSRTTNLGPEAFNMDPYGEVLWNNSYKMAKESPRALIYYRYPLNLKDAYEFLILHELAHYSGVSSESRARELSRRWLVDVRRWRVDGSRPYNLSRINWKEPDRFSIAGNTSRQSLDSIYSFQTVAILPPDNDLPPAW